jgi:ABC-2 type transport system permease protein
MSFPAAARGEWIKVRSTRSLTTALTAVLVLTAVASTLLCATLGGRQHEADFDPLFSSYGGLSFGQLAVSVFGALAVATEYRGGAIRVSLTAVPRRGRFYCAKLAVVAAPAFAVGLITGLVSFISGQAVMDKGVGIGIGDDGAARAVVGCALYFALVALFSAGLATLLRSVIGVLCVLIPLFLLVPFVFADVPGGSGVPAFLPDHAGRQILLQDPTGTLGAWGGMAVLAAWAAAAVAAGWIALHARDA